MRITVTIVVIMFELTGALTYILPTMVRNADGTFARRQLKRAHPDRPASHEGRGGFLWRSGDRGRNDQVQRLSVPRQGGTRVQYIRYANAVGSSAPGCSLSCG